MRYERKYKIEGASAESINQVIRMHPAGFVKAFPDRWVNNIYFDGIHFSKLRENHDGVSRRTKYRLRWYGDLYPVTKAVLEAKSKVNLLGNKKQQPLDLSGASSVNDILNRVGLLLPNSPPLHPTLLNRYKRSYFATRNGLFRITLDTLIFYFPIFEKNPSIPLDKLLRTDSLSWVPETASILEFKYPVEKESEAKDWSQYIPFRMTKYSKYATGLQKCTSIPG